MEKIRAGNQMFRKRWQLEFSPSAKLKKEAWQNKWNDVLDSE